VILPSASLLLSPRKSPLNGPTAKVGIRRKSRQIARSQQAKLTNENRGTAFPLR
jgi:hypothetical protein